MPTQIEDPPVPDGYAPKTIGPKIEIYRAADGSEYGRRRAPARGPVVREWWIDAEGRPHRGGGLPANLTRDDQGHETMEWYVEGRRSRLDGPACVYGPGVPEVWFISDTPVANRHELLRAVCLLDGQIAEREVKHSVFGPLLDEGFAVEKILEAVRRGLSTNEGVRAFFAGAPVEWAKAFETGRT